VVREDSGLRPQARVRDGDLNVRYSMISMGDRT
jgi:hypothetical protein